MSELGRYVLNQVRSLTHSDKRPVIQDIHDRGTKVTLNFSVGDQKVSVTASDLFLASLSPVVEKTLTLPRQQFLAALTKEVVSGIREDLIRQRVEIDFSQPVSDEVLQDAKQLAEEIVRDKKAQFITNLGYLVSCGTPIFVYQVLKFIIPLMERNNITVSDKMRDALKNPQEYLNPYYIALNYDNQVDNISRQESSEDMYNEVF